MEEMLQHHQRMRAVRPYSDLSKGIRWGVVGGLIGTLVMDMVLMGVLAAAGWPALSCFTIVGDTMAKLFAVQITGAARSIPLGIATHYLVGPMIGAIFGTGITKIHILRRASVKKGIVYSVLYVEILSQPLLALAPMLLKMSAAETLQWYGGALIMHLLWGIVLGTIVYRGLTPPPREHRGDKR